MKKFFLTISILCFFVGQQSYAGNGEAANAVTKVTRIIVPVLGSVIIGLNSWSYYLRSQQDEPLNMEIPVIAVTALQIAVFPVTYFAYKYYVDNENCCYDR